jgi:bifunctional non-homologous end joining protein LigD
MRELTRVEFTNLDKILYPALNVTKKQVLEYYIRVAPNMLEYLKGRVIVVNRFPDGVQKKGFYGKDAPQGTPDWIETLRVHSDSADRSLNYVVGRDLDTLIWLANRASLEINITLSKARSYETPDLVFIDLDPEPPAGLEEAIEIALLVRDKLSDLGLKLYVKTSGKKGLHLLLPIAEEYAFSQTREFVRTIGRHVAKESEIAVAEFSQGRDPGTIFIDFMQNTKGRTMIAPYSLRAEPGATISTPQGWREIRKGLKPEEFNIFTVPKRAVDPWEGMLQDKQKLEVK